MGKCQVDINSIQRERRFVRIITKMYQTESNLALIGLGVCQTKAPTCVLAQMGPDLWSTKRAYMCYPRWNLSYMHIRPDGAPKGPICVIPDGT